MGRPFTPHIVTEESASSAQVIDGSVKFDGDLAHYLTKTPSSVGNQKTFTFSCWCKRSRFGTHSALFSSSGNGDFFKFSFRDDNRFEINTTDGGTDSTHLFSTARFRDTTGWYHIVIAFDTTQGTSTNRVKIYVNNTQITDFDLSTYPGQNVDTSANDNVQHIIGNQVGTTRYFDGMISNVYMIDGQQLSPTEFGFTDPLTNTWRPKKYTGTYGTNGFYLPMDGNSPIGKDQSGNGNDFTPVNFGGSNSIEKATGALPILNTVNGGTTATATVREDANASNLIFALPLAGDITEVTPRINNARTALSFTDSGSTDTVVRHFYGGSRNFDGSNDFLKASIPDSDALHLQASSWTVECWFRADVLPGGTDVYLGGVRLASVSANSDVCWNLRIYNNVIEGMWNTGNTQHKTVSPYAITATKWTHAAYVRDGNEQRLYQDGVLVATTSYTTTPNLNNSSFFEIGGRTAGNYFNGKIQDFRIYNNLAKYTGDFIPAAFVPDIRPDTPSGVAYGSELKQITEGSVNGGVSNGDTLLVGNSSDFSFGSGDFTAELFAYHTSTAGNDTLLGIWNSGANRRSWMIDIEADQGRLRGYWSTAGSNNSSIQTATNYIARRRWNHIVFCRQGNTMRLYLNGNQEATATESGSLYNNTDDSLGILSATDTGSDPCRGHISNVRVIKGTCLYPDGTSFTPPSAPLTNVTNTVLLACQSPTSATAYEVSPGTITTSGSVSPSTFNPFTDDINTVRGQENAYCTLNATATYNGDGADIQDGGLKFECPASGDVSARGTIPIPAGSKFYMEARYRAVVGSGGQARLGITQVQQGYTKSGTGMWSIDFRGSAGTIQKDDEGTVTTLTGNPDQNDIVGIKIDLATGEFRAHHRGIYYNAGNALMTGIPNVESYFFAALDGGPNRNDWDDINFGQKPWEYPPGDGYQPLCSANLPLPTEAAVRPDKYFNTALYTANNTSKSITVGFRPDFIWFKNRTGTNWHALFDSVRGRAHGLSTNVLNTEYTTSSASSDLVSFDSNGFTIGPNEDWGSVNGSSGDIVAWSWKAGGNSGTFNIDGRGYATAAEAGLTAGTKASLLTGASVNTESGFSILTWTGDGATSNLQIPHGLPTRPKMVVIKKRNEAVDDWYVAHDSIQGTNYAYRMFFGPTNGTALPSGSTGATNPYYLGNQSSNETDPKLYLSNDATYGGGNENNIDYVGYCWSEVPGFSKFGTYTGNGAVNGPLIECGFRPAWVMVKVAGGSSGNSWTVWDNKRDTHNEMDLYLHPNEAQQDGTYFAIKMDFYSNGFKPRGDIVHQNTSGVKYIYTAFAEAPTVNLYGGQSNAR